MMTGQLVPPSKGIVAVIGAVALALLVAGCDTSDEGVTVTNLCGETLRVSITEYTQSAVNEQTARYEAREYGVEVASGVSLGGNLMRGAGGYLVVALSDDDQIFFQWRSFDESRQILLRDDLGTCPQGT